jgi:hypothetical protein
MDMSQPVSPAVDANALAEALGTLGLLYGDRAALAGAAAGAADEDSAIRAFLDALVALVLDARARNDRAPVSIETYSPA